MWQEDGNWDLTIVSAMGVITDGAYGREMAPAFDRLLSTRGISLRRVPTGLFRTLEFNARAIISEVRQVQGPWAWLGYSQGCANCLRAEHIMMTGTPELRALADRIACRQMIFSAANGSVHAPAGARLFADADRRREVPKHYPGRLSRNSFRVPEDGRGSGQPRFHGACRPVVDDLRQGVIHVTVFSRLACRHPRLSRRRLERLPTGFGSFGMQIG